MKKSSLRRGDFFVGFLDGYGISFRNKNFRPKKFLPLNDITNASFFPAVRAGPFKNHL
jgi:hypothetical protein